MNPDYFDSIIHKKPLLVLNASAGSGKTYNLVRNYIRLLLSDETQAEPSQILAMTFTNKASTEMKHRIISDLNKLASGKKENESFLTETANFIKLSPDKIKNRAHHVLRKILHQYEDFGVMTIDKFNLRLIRSFSRDLDLPDQFEISTKDDVALEKAIDDLLSVVDQKLHPQLYQLAFNFVNSNIEEDQKWDIKRNLLQFARILTQERMIPLVNLLKEQSFSKDEYNQHRQFYQTEKKAIQIIQKSLWNELLVSDLSSKDLFNGTKTLNGIQKTLSMSIDELVQDKKSISDAHYANIQKNIAQNDIPFITKYFQFINDFQSKKAELYKSKFIYSQFYSLALLKELAIRMEQVRINESTIRVSEFNQLIAELIKQEDAPFIYERLGNRYNHFFLDEFQDTSRLQWLNMIPLIHNSISFNQFNFIVGDPKQAIYRFKNGVADQFVELPQIYNPENDQRLIEKSTYFNLMGYKDGLDDNWRSAKEIVQFNNSFFETLKPKLPSKGELYYEVIRQNPKGKNGGYIEIYFRQDKECLVKEEKVDRLLSWVKSCLSDGYKPKDICILSSKNDLSTFYATHLKQNGYQVVSGDSLAISSDLFVQLSVAFIKWKLNRFNQQAKIQFAHLFFMQQDEETALEKLNQCYEDNLYSKQTFSETVFYNISDFPKHLIDLPFQNIYTLLVDFFNQIKVNPTENSYVQQLLDYAYEFDLRNGSDLLSFYQDYEISGHKMSVQLTANDNAIQLMTAHKSKGLEFPVVMIPDMNFFSSNTSKSDILIEIDNQIFKTKLSENDSQLDEISEEQKLDNDAEILDRINLLYVAFTRPKDRLYAMQLQKQNAKKFEPVIQTLIEMYPGSKNDSEFELKLGDKPKITQDIASDEATYQPSYINQFLWFPEISLQSKKEGENENLSEAIRLGNQFHYLMEKSQNIQSGIQILNQGIMKGEIDILFKNQLEDMLQKAYRDNQLIALYEQGAHLSERNFIVGKNQVLRPDKLILSKDSTTVIDFKTGDEHKRYEKQIKEYISVLKEVGYPSIKGYLYYVSGAGLKEVV